MLLTLLAKLRYNDILSIAFKYGISKLHMMLNSHVKHSTPCLKKTSHLWLAITLMHINGF